MYCQNRTLQSLEPQAAMPAIARQPVRTTQPDDASDRDLVRRISGADRDAFRQLYVEYHRRLARFLVRVLRNPEDLEEVVNDTFLIVWRRAGDFRGASRVSTWILGIAYRRALKSMRSAASWLRAATLATEGIETAIDDTTSKTENQQLLDFGLSSLRPEERLVLVLAYRMDHSCEEIAAIAGCPVNTVKSRMFQARRKLRAIIAAADVPQRPA